MALFDTWACFSSPSLLAGSLAGRGRRREEWLSACQAAWAGQEEGEGRDEWLPACQAALSRRQLEPAKLADDEMPFAALTYM